MGLSSRKNSWDRSFEKGEKTAPVGPCGWDGAEASSQVMSRRAWVTEFPFAVHRVPGVLLSMCHKHLTNGRKEWVRMHTVVLQSGHLLLKGLAIKTLILISNMLTHILLKVYFMKICELE